MGNCSAYVMPATLVSKACNATTAKGQKRLRCWIGRKESPLNGCESRCGPAKRLLDCNSLSQRAAIERLRTHGAVVNVLLPFTCRWPAVPPGRHAVFQFPPNRN